MARITLGAAINSIKGSIDQVTFSTWKGINYIRSKAKTISNPQSAEQQKVRARLAECSKYWYDTLTQVERDAWETYAASIPVPSSGPGDIIKPGTGPYSGFNAFCRNNLNAFTAGVSALGVFITAAPIGITPPDALLTVAASFALGAMTVTWVEGTVKGTKARVWIRSYDNKIHAQVTSTPLANALTVDFSDVAGGLGKYLPLAVMPGVYDIQMDVVDDDGQPSPASNLVRNVVVA